MFNKDFYPTPKHVIERMLIGLDITDKVVLEPSSGKGDIIDCLKEYGAKAKGWALPTNTGSDVRRKGKEVATL